MGVSTMTVSEARAALAGVLNRVLDGEEVTITRHGTPVAVVVRPDSLRVRRASHRTSPGPSEERAEALVASMSEARAFRGSGWDGDLDEMRGAARGDS